MATQQTQFEQLVTLGGEAHFVEKLLGDERFGEKVTEVIIDRAVPLPIIKFIVPTESVDEIQQIEMWARHYTMRAFDKVGVDFSG